MNERIKNHINMLFDNAPKTRKAFELKEELLANSEERYQDLITNGVTQEDAIKNVIKSLGNVEELFQGLEDISQEDRTEYQKYVKKSAIIKTVAAGLYVFSLVVLFYCIYLNDTANSSVVDIVGLIVVKNSVNYVMLGVVIAVLIDIVPTCMLVYITSLAPKYKKQGDTVVEEFKAWNRNTERAKSVRNAASGVLWTAALFIYFALSLSTYDWYATWIVFLVAACLQMVIILIFRLRESN